MKFSIKDNNPSSAIWYSSNMTNDERRGIHYYLIIRKWSFGSRRLSKQSSVESAKLLVPENTDSFFLQRKPSTSEIPVRHAKV